jgi:hypothetical protein
VSPTTAAASVAAVGEAEPGAAGEIDAGAAGRVDPDGAGLRRSAGPGRAAPTRRPGLPRRQASSSAGPGEAR